VPGERLESQFMELLEALRPDPVFARLFEAVARDVWNDREASSSRAVAAAEGRLQGVRQRLTEVDRAFVIAKSIDSRSHYALRDSLREEQALAEMALKEARIDELDIEGALAASEAILSNAAELWQRASIEQRHKLQAALFPEGLTHDGRGFGTAVTCAAFRGLHAFACMTEGVASPTGRSFMWQRPLQWNVRVQRRGWHRRTQAIQSAC